MDSGSVTFQAFRFLDIRAPQIDDPGGSTYVIDRQSLEFPETVFEAFLRKSGGENPKQYIKVVKDAALKTSKGLGDAMPTGGFLDDRRTYEDLLTAKQLSPEAVFASVAEFFKQSKGEQTDQDYLIDKIAAVWDLYLASTILKVLGASPGDPYLLRDLASAVRVSAAIFAVRKPDNEDRDLRSLAIASIWIPSELFDPSIVREAQEKQVLPVADESARQLQNESLSKIIVLSLAKKELRAVFLNESFPQPSPPPSPPAPPAPTPGSEVLASQSIDEFVVSVAKSRLSASSKTLLLSEFGASDAGNNIDNIPIVRVFGSIERQISQFGDTIFGSANQEAIAQFARQLKLFEKDLSKTGSVDVDKLRFLPLSLSPAVFGAKSLKFFPQGANVRPLGVGDLKVVKQNLLRYESSEVAHVENILKGQQKERIHSVKQKTEDTLVVEQEKSTSSERDLQTTDRFELSEESSSTVAEKRQNEFGVTVTASYGAVSISANTKFSDSSTTEQSNKISRSFAREVVDRSIEKVQQRVREERVRKTTLEIEETNRYSLTASTNSVVGIYRWIDKIYWAQVHVYGKRLMLEFMVPEPAALHIHSLSQKTEEPGSVLPPEPFKITSKDIQSWNYASLAAKYSAEVEAPPPSIRLATTAARTMSDTAPTNISVPDGFVGVWAGPSYAGYAYKGATIQIMVGPNYWVSGQNWYYQNFYQPITGAIPLMVTSQGFTSYNVSAIVGCIPSDYLYEQWQLGTFKAIQQAYQLRLGEYEEYLARRNQNNTPQLQRPDREARDIERRELQRACIEMLSQQHFDALGAINDNPLTGWPEIDFNSVGEQGDYALFFQHGFEWEQMTYVFYPYFWARQSEWQKKLRSAGEDMLFSRFLMAGFARVVVPVRPAHESDILYFLETGRIWGDTEPPVLGDPRFVNIIEEIKEALDAPDQGVPEGDPWQFKVPTSLIMLDDTGKLPEWPVTLDPPKDFVPSKETCGGVPYNAAQWKNAKIIADAIRKLGYSIDSMGDQDKALKKSAGLIRAMQMRFNYLGVEAVIGRTLKVDGIVGPCTLRALTYFDGLREKGKWPGAA